MLDAMESLEERIARAVWIALGENQGIPLQEVPPLLRDPPSKSPPPPRENHVATPFVSREEESSSTSSPRRLAHGEADILEDLKKYPTKLSFGGRNCKPKEVMSFILIVEDFFPSKYTDADKIKVFVIFFKDKARVWFDTLKRDRENRGLGPIATWSTCKELFLHQFLPGNYGEDMRQKLYNLKQKSLSVIHFKLEFDEHIVYFPNWGESDKIEFFVRNLKDSIRFKVSAHSPLTLDEAYGLAMNFDGEVNSRTERKKFQL